MIPGSTGPTLYIIDVASYTEEIQDTISSHNWSEQDHILFYNFIDPKNVPLDIEPARYTMVKDLLSASETKEIEEIATDLSQSWHRGINLKYMGIELSSLLSFLKVFFIEKLQDVANISRMLEHFKPETIYVLTDRPSFADIENIFGLNCIFLGSNREGYLGLVANWLKFSHNRVFRILQKIRVIDKLICSAEKAILTDWYLMPCKQDFEGNGYLVVIASEDYLLQEASNKIKSFSVIKRRNYKLESKKISVRKEKALKMWKRAVNEVNQDRKIEFKGYDLTECFTDKLLSFQQGFVLTFIKLINIWFKQLQGVKGIKSVIVSNDNLPYQNALIGIAKKLKIHSTLVQHGAIGEDRYSTDAAILWGKCAIRNRESVVNPQVHFNVLGNSRYDHYASLDPARIEEWRRKLRERFLVTPADHVVTYATSWDSLELAGYYHGFFMQGFHAFVDAVLDRPYITVVLRFHPGETANNILDHLRYIRRHGIDHRVIFEPDFNMLDCLIFSDVLVSNFSSISLDAMMLQRPVVAVNLSNLPDPLPFTEYEAAYVARSKDEIGLAIDRALECGYSEGVARQQARFIEDYAYKIDGRATQRLIEFVEALKQ